MPVLQVALLSVFNSPADNLFGCKLQNKQRLSLVRQESGELYLRASTLYREFV